MILNLVLGCYVIYLCVQGVKFTREKYGLFAAIIMALGMMSFMSGTGSRGRNDKQMVKWENPVKDDSFAYRSKGLEKILVFNNLMFSGKLFVSYIVKNGIKEPYFVTCGLNGTTGSFHWEAEHIDIAKSEDKKNEYRYTVYSTSVFRILRMNFLTQYREYSGVFRLD